MVNVWLVCVSYNNCVKGIFKIRALIIVSFASLVSGKWVSHASANIWIVGVMLGLWLTLVRYCNISWVQVVAHCVRHVCIRLLLLVQKFMRCNREPVELDMNKP